MSQYDNFTTFRSTLCDGMLHITIDGRTITRRDHQCAYDLLQLLDMLRSDSAVQVVVFSSNNPDFFLIQYYLDSEFESTSPVSIDHAYFTLWTQLLLELAALPQTTVAIVEDKVKGAGNGFLIACDLTIHCSNPEVALLPVLIPNYYEND